MTRLGAYAALTGSVTFWGGSFVAMKVVLPEMSPGVMVVTRFVIGCAVLALTLAWRGSLWLPGRRDLAATAVLGAIGVTLHQWLQATGLQTSAASVSSWIVAISPIFVVILGWALLRERVTGGRTLGILVAATGMLVIVSQGRLGAFLAGRAWIPGDGLILASAVNWAVFTVLSKYVIDRGDALPVRRDRSMVLMFYTLVFGLLFSLPWAAVQGGWGALGHLSTNAWVGMGFLGVACSGLAYIFWFAGLEAVDATQVGAFLYLEPVVTSLVAVPVLGEPITGPLLVGGAAILSGLWLVNRT
jgi:drug/metabolite transporter (DMT)-like permease